MFTKKLRNEFADCSSGAGGRNYYETKGHAFNAFDSVLEDYNLKLDRTENWFELSNDSGSLLFRVLTDSDEVAGYANLSWYRMPSGRYEFTGYLT